MHPETRQRLMLVKNGVHFDVAFSVDKMTAAAWGIIFMELDGLKWDWGRMAPEKPKDSRR